MDRIVLESIQNLLIEIKRRFRSSPETAMVRRLESAISHLSLAVTDDDAYHSPGNVIVIRPFVIDCNERLTYKFWNVVFVNQFNRRCTAQSVPAEDKQTAIDAARKMMQFGHDWICLSVEQTNS